VSDSHRIARVEEQIKREVAACLAGHIHEPAVKLVTVLWVKVAKDLSYADVYVSVHGDDASAVAGMETLARCRPFVQRVVAERIRLRKTPRVRFRLDKEYRAANRVFEILKELKHDGGPDQGNLENT
jgi:ribosome-binding factor A